MKKLCKLAKRRIALVLAMLMVFQPAVTVLADTGEGSFLSENSGERENSPEKETGLTASPSEKTTPSAAAKEVPFEQSAEADGTVVTVTAEAGVFPEDAELSVKKVTGKTELEGIESAVGNERGEAVKVSGFLAFDIKVLSGGEEIQPDTEKGSVRVSFSLGEEDDGNSEVSIWHLKEKAEEKTEEKTEKKNRTARSDGLRLSAAGTQEKAEETETEPETESGYTASALSVTREGGTFTVETESFSYYVVEFTYGNLQYILDGDGEIKLSVIQETVNLTGTVTDAVPSDPELFDVKKDAGGKDWTVEAKQAFTSEESLTVTIGGKEYVIAVTDAVTPNYLTFTAAEANSSVELSWRSGSNVEYSLDGGKNWSGYAEGSTISLAAVGDSVSFRGNNVTTGKVPNYYVWEKFEMTGRILASGSVTSLTDGNGGNPNVQLSDNCYEFMFRECESLLTAPELPSTKLAKECYKWMFADCSALTAAPALPAAALAEGCYYGMFEDCSSLAQAPVLPAERMAEDCYGSMFSGCSSLTQAPVLPAMTLAPHCYYRMFSGCRSLTQAPALPAESLAEGCYGLMFNYCQALTKAPALPAVTLAEACYYSMFYKCSALKKAPALPATTLAESCYNSMFYDSGLTEAPALPATTLAEKCYYYMFSDCSLTEAPDLPATVLAKDCYHGMFYRCWILSKAPATLPATVLAEGCYSYMFADSNELTQAPSLPATVLAKDCYNAMFENCPRLTQAPALPATRLAEGCYQAMFYGSGLTQAPVLPATAMEKNCYNLMLACCALTQGPSLPATKLAEGCYREMFYGCGSLIEAPALPAETLAADCYRSMFKSCLSLVKVPSLPATVLADGCYWSMFESCSLLDVSAVQDTEHAVLWKIPATESAANWNRDMFKNCSGVDLGGGAKVPALNTGYYQPSVARYSVVHKKQNVAGTAYAVADTEVFAGKSGTSITPAVKNYEGFASPGTKTDTIRADGSTVVTYLYTRNSYTVKFNGNGATSGTMADQARKYGDRKALTANAFKKTGYAFVCWASGADGTGKGYENKTKEDISTAAGTVTLYAVWKPVQYTVTYNLNGGKNNSKNPASFYVTTADITLQKATKTGYTFAGWYSDPELKTKVTVIRKGTSKSQILYAKWTANAYTVKFNANGGTGTMSAQARKYNDKKALTSNAFRKTGYTFTGWNTKADGKGTKFADKAVSNIRSTAGTSTLYAQWTRTKYTVTYNLKGGKNNSGNPAYFYYNTADIRLKKPSKTGYTFGGWYSDSKYTTKVTVIKKGTLKSQVLYAKWTANAYTVKFNGNGSTSGSMTGQSRKYGDKAALTANAFKKKGYTFTGWNTKADGKGTSYADKAVSNLRTTAGTVTLYAQWVSNKKKFTVTYNLDGGKNNSKNPSGYYVTTADITLQKPTKTGYTFAGWYSDPEFKTKVTVIRKGSTGNRTLYAKWTVNRYTVRFNANGGTGTMKDLTGIAYGASRTLTANAFKRTGYTFAGWSVSAAGSVKYKDKASVKNLSSKNGAAVSLYAQWKKN